MNKDTCHAIFLKLNKAERFEVIEMLVKKINSFDEVEIIVSALDLHISRPTTNTADIFDQDEFHDSVEDADTDKEMATVKFVPDDLVLVDFPECGYWPCRITGVLNKDWRKVEYFGGREIGKAHVKVIREYDEDARNNLEKYIPERKRKKNPKLKLAVKQINEKFIRARSLAMKTGDGTEEIGVSNKKKRSGVTPGRGPQRSIAPPPAHIPVDQFDQLAGSADRMRDVRPLRAPHLPPVHGQQADQRERLPLAVHGVQDLHRLLHRRERSTNAVLRRLRPRLPHVLHRAAHQGGPGGHLELRQLCGQVSQGLEAPEGTWSCVSCVDKFHKD